jgi:hypothetical protein
MRLCAEPSERLLWVGLSRWLGSRAAGDNLDGPRMASPGGERTVPGETGFSPEAGHHPEPDVAGVLLVTRQLTA